MIDWENFGSGIVIILCFLFVAGFIAFVLYSTYEIITHMNKKYKRSFWGFTWDLLTVVVTIVIISCGIKFLVTENLPIQCNQSLNLSNVKMQGIKIQDIPIYFQDGEDTLTTYKRRNK